MKETEYNDETMVVKNMVTTSGNNNQQLVGPNPNRVAITISVSSSTAANFVWVSIGDVCSSTDFCFVVFPNQAATKLTREEIGDAITQAFTVSGGVGRVVAAMEVVKK